MNDDQQSEKLPNPEFSRPTRQEQCSRCTDCHRLLPSTLKGVRAVAFSWLPILQWLPRYSIRDSLHSDLVTGLTVGIMVVPQAMGYATLAKLDPVYGLYTCFFAAFFYMFFGSSRHVSIGTFAVASMMVGSLKTKLFPDPIPHSTALDLPLPMLMTSSNGTPTAIAVSNSIEADVERGPIDLDADVTPIVLTSALTFGVGIMQLLMYLFRLSFLTTYITDPLVSGFTTGAAVHVLTAQLDKALGMRIKPRSGPGMILMMLADIVTGLPHANLATVCLSAAGLVVLAIGRDVIGPRVLARWRFPFPVELLLVIAAIFVSSHLELRERFGVRVVDHVPEGLPMPSLPRISLFRWTWMDCLSIAVICFVFVISLVKIFAKKHRYRVDADNELRALGFSTLLSSLFPVYPFGASLSRSALCEMTGAKTPLHALFSSSLLFVVILWMGRFLEPLPMAILACIVIISLKSLFLQFRALPVLWTISRFDFATWLIAFVSTAGLDITWGLCLSVLSVLLFNAFREQWPRFRQLYLPVGNARESSGSTEGDEELVLRSIACNFFDAGLTLCSTASTARLLPHPKGAGVVQCWRWEAPVHFANAARFTERVAELLQHISAASAGTIDENCRRLTPESIVVSLPSSHAKAADVEEQKSSIARHAASSPSKSEDDDEMTRSSGCDRKSPTSMSGGGSPLTDKQIISDRQCLSSLLVIEASAITSVDSMGVEALAEALRDAERAGVVLRFAGIGECVTTVLDRCEQLVGRHGGELRRRYLVPQKHRFASVVDALTAPLVVVMGDDDVVSPDA